MIIMKAFELNNCLSLCSTNGTVINKLKVVKKQTCPLQTGDVIYVVYRKNEPENSKRISFFFLMALASHKGYKGISDGENRATQ